MNRTIYYSTEKGTRLSKTVALFRSTQTVGPHRLFVGIGTKRVRSKYFDEKEPALHLNGAAKVSQMKF